MTVQFKTTSINSSTGQKESTILHETSLSKLCSKMGITVFTVPSWQKHMVSFLATRANVTVSNFVYDCISNSLRDRIALETFLSTQDIDTFKNPSNDYMPQLSCYISLSTYSLLNDLARRYSISVSYLVSLVIDFAFDQYLDVKLNSSRKISAVVKLHMNE